MLIQFFVTLTCSLCYGCLHHSMLDMVIASHSRFLLKTSLVPDTPGKFILTTKVSPLLLQRHLKYVAYTKLNRVCLSDSHIDQGAVLSSLSLHHPITSMTMFTLRPTPREILTKTTKWSTLD